MDLLSKLYELPYVGCPESAERLHNLLMTLTDDERAMLDGVGGEARQKAMDLLVRYAEALGAERFVNTNNVAGVPGSSTLFLQNYYLQNAGGGSYETIFSRYDLDSDET